MDTNTPVYLTIPVDKIKPFRHQARRDFDEEGLKSLAESIKLEGLQQPISVRRVGEEYELIAGVRRLGLRREALLIHPILSRASRQRPRRPGIPNRLLS